MIYLEFEISLDNGAIARFDLNDSKINYSAIRNVLSESSCIEVIENVKKISGKKCALIFGNCQTEQLNKIFWRHIQFNREYFLLQIPAVCDYKDWIVEFIFGGGGQFLQQVDLFISQHVKEANRFGTKIATKNIVTQLREDAKIIWIPNAYFDGYFPQYTHNARNIVINDEPTGLFPNGDRFIDEIMENSEMNPDIEKILDRICDPDFISPEIIQNQTEKSLDELKNREWICDVKISDYIEDNFRDEQIFWSINHPSSLVLFELAKRIWRLIGMRSENFLDREMLFNPEDIYGLRIQDIPIYPSVQRFFGFKKCLDKYFANQLTWNLHADFRTFSREYILKCWAEKFTR